MIALGLLQFSGCISYPFNTPQAKEWRKARANAAKMARQASVADLKKEQALPGKGKKLDSLVNKPINEGVAQGKKNDISKDSISVANPKQDIVVIDTIAKPIRDTLPVKKPNRPIAYSKDSLDAPVSYSARDSMMEDIPNRKVYLWGAATVTYKDMEIKADYIEFDFKMKQASATHSIDSNGYRVGDPEFKSGEQQFSAQRMIYNFDTKKGKVYNATTQQGDGYLLSQETKFIAKKEGRNEDDIIYNGNGIYTTCDHPTPHFGIRSMRSKVIPNKLIVIGPSLLEVGGIPTPLALPFGFFPVTSTRKSGFLMPSPVGHPNQGFGLTGIGWYFGLSDYLDLELYGDIYMRGSFGVGAKSNYAKKHKYSGNVGIKFSFLTVDEPGTPNYSSSTDFQLNWSHNMARESNPKHNFSGSVNLATGNFFKNNRVDGASTLTNTINSSLAYTRTFPGKPILLTAGMQHSQDISNRSISITLPVVNFQLQQIYPFKRKRQIGKKRWYEDIGFRYSTQFSSSINTRDSLLFSARAGDVISDNIRFGIQHQPQVSMAFKLFKYINLNPTVNYNERWYFYRTKVGFDPSQGAYGVNDTIREYGFYRVSDFDAGLSLNTQLYGRLNFKKGYLRTLRHVVTPNVSFNWRPDFGEPVWGYWDSVQTDVRQPNLYKRYNRYQDAIYGSPGTGKSMVMNFSLNNLIEAKVRSKQDTVTGLKKVVLFNPISLNTSYNFLADSINLSPIRLSANTRLFKIINVTIGATYDVYAKVGGKVVNRSSLSVTGDLLRLDNANISIGTSFSGADMRNWLSNKGAKKIQQTSPFDILQNASINYNLNLRSQYDINLEDEVFKSIQNLGFNANLKPSPNWSVGLNFNYDFDNNRIANPNFNLSRKLHCWDLGLNWAPEQQFWSFFLRVSSPTLNFLNIPATGRGNFL